MAKKSNSSAAKKFALGAAIAATAGYIAGMLTAPQSGKDTRQDVKDTAAKGVAEAESQLQAVEEELKALLNDPLDEGKKLSKQAKQELEDLAEKAGDAKDKTAEVVTALRNGKADSKELQRALNDAKATIKHLRKYLSK
ncbi:YtxH domain-containing protein [Aeromicrobium sp.]|nr:YtxH domain-containing protein [Candidatus Saccharibacteria bacterium]